MLTLLCIAFAVQAPTYQVYGLSLNGSRAFTEKTTLNGVEVHANVNAEADSSSASIPLQDFIVTGKNVLVVTLSKAAKDATLEVALELDTASPNGDVKTEVLQKVRFDGTSGKKTMTFNVTMKIPPGAWTRGEKLVASKALEADVIAASKAVEDTITAGKWEVYSDTFAHVYARRAALYPIYGTPDAVREGSVKEAKEFFGSKEFGGFVPLDGPVMCSLRNNGRAVTCVRKDGSALVQYTATFDPKPMEMPLVFSRIDGRLQVVAR